MTAKRAYRDRGDVEVAVLDALVDRGREGMTVLELRAAVDADIDAIETALTGLKSDDLLTVEKDEQHTIIKPDERVIPGPGEDDIEPSLFERLREYLPF